MLGQKLNQCSNNVKNATTICVECVRNPVTMDEEFQALVEYVEHQLLVKANMALYATWGKKKPQKVEEYVKKKMQEWEALVPPHLKHITWGWHLMFQILTIVPLLQGLFP